jgi:ribosomal protein S8
MVMDTSSIFIARFNSSVSQRSKTFFVPVSKFSSQILDLLYREGYIFSYKFVSETKDFLVFPNHVSVNFKFKKVSLSSRKLFLSAFAFKKQVNRGRFLVIQTSYGLQFSDTAHLYKIGGVPVFILNHFLYGNLA